MTMCYSIIKSAEPVSAILFYFNSCSPFRFFAYRDRGYTFDAQFRDGSEDTIPVLVLDPGHNPNKLWFPPHIMTPYI